MGTISDRFRFYYAPLIYQEEWIEGSAPIIIDISEFVTDYSFAWDADSAKRSGSVTIDLTGMPSEARNIVLTDPTGLPHYNITSNIGQGCVFACHEMLIAEEWYRWPIGWFFARQTAYERNGLNDIEIIKSGGLDILIPSAIGTAPMKMDLLDLTAYFDIMQCPSSYQVPAGTNYLTAMKQAVDDSGFWDYQAFNITGAAGFKVGRWPLGITNHVTPRAITVQARTTWRSLLDTLSEGSNHFPLFTAPNGEFTTGKRIRPGLQQVKDWHGSTLSMDKFQRASDGAYSNKYGRGSSWDGDMSAKLGFSFPQAGLWNQVVTKGSFASETAMHNVSQIFDPSSLLDQTRIGQWVTIEKNIENPSGSGVLQEIADWYVYYADFHSVQLTIETPATFFVDKRINPYHKASIGTDWRTGYPSYWDYVELGWSFSKDQPMIRRYGTSPKLYNVIINQPADPS